jgi:hypothetical protein
LQPAYKKARKLSPKFADERLTPVKMAAIKKVLRKVTTANIRPALVCYALHNNIKKTVLLG